MKKILSLTIGALVAFTVAATSISAPAFAGKRERGIAAGAILGIIGGVIIADEIHRSKKRRRARRNYNRYDRYDSQPYYGSRNFRPRVRYNDYYDQPRVRHQRRYYQRRIRSAPRLSRYERHVRRCYAAYRTYDQRSDTFIGYDGREHQCRK